MCGPVLYPNPSPHTCLRGADDLAVMCTPPGRHVQHLPACLLRILVPLQVHPQQGHVVEDVGSLGALDAILLGGGRVGWGGGGPV